MAVVWHPPHSVRGEEEPMRHSPKRPLTLLVLTSLAALVLVACGVEGQPPPAGAALWDTARWDTATWRP